MSDSELDREIVSAVGIEPSPEFLARVRTRIASESVVESGFSRIRPAVESGFSRIRQPALEPLWAVALGGIVLALVIPQFMRKETTTPLPQMMPVPVAEVPAAAVVPGTASQLAVAGSQPAAASLHHEAPAAVEQAESPHMLPLQLSPVLFAEEDRLAFARFVTAVSAGTVPEEAVQALGEDEMTPLGIASLVIDPLPPLARVERQGEGQW